MVMVIIKNYCVVSYSSFNRYIIILYYSHNRFPLLARKMRKDLSEIVGLVRPRKAWELLGIKKRCF
ncbi:hypothetical protein Hanom_Chr17g01538161 [Helianthus anomalus]